MTHPYNTLKTCLSFLLLSPLLAILGQAAKVWHLEEGGQQCQTLASVLAVLCLLRALSLVLWERPKGQTLSQFFLSLKATFLIRRYCHFESVEGILTLEGKPTTAHNRIIRRANRSLQQLTIQVIQDTASLKWRLPSNHESKALLVALFPAIRAELSTILPHYMFSDITNLKGNYYDAQASKR